ncbi:hypothetical protein ACHHYP_20767 [Achlya hypogyna]|uniref:FYVE-type domain-containing protein n=1 Tax=Achlya hypogyna TaxID=1202772 RepID=A0A1V9YB21_ACHHY|nr:hypothetical protein ACHHYP_20767 [Achlya hypogyna]
MTLPLPLDHFKCPPLTPEGFENIVSLGQAACQDTVQNAIAAQSEPVVSVVSNQKTSRLARIHRGRDVVDPWLTTYTGRSLIQASIAEVADFFYLDSKEKLTTYKTVLGQNMLDRQTLYTLTDSSDGHASFHYCGIAWMATQFPALMSNRDTCFVEFHDLIEVMDQSSMELRRGWVRTIHSLEMDCVPSLKASHGLVRSQLLRSGHVFLETKTPGILEHFHIIVPQMHGLIKGHILREICQRQVSRVLNLEEYFATQRFLKTLDTSLLMPITSFQQKDLVGWCSVCSRKFGWFVHKKHCRKCGHVICSNCLSDWHFSIKHHVVKLRICRQCFAGASIEALEDGQRRTTQSTLTLDSTDRKQTLKSNSSSELDDLPMLDRTTEGMLDHLETFDQHMELSKLNHDSRSSASSSSFGSVLNASHMSNEAAPAHTRVSLFSVTNSNLDLTSSFCSYLYTQVTKYEQVAAVIAQDQKVLAAKKESLMVSKA